MARGFNYAPVASDEVREARQPGMPKGQLVVLAQSRNTLVRAAVAGREDCPLGLMATLADDPSAEVRVALAGNPITQRTIVTILSEDRSVDVLVALLANPLLASEIVDRLAVHKKGEVRAAAAQRIRSGAAPLAGAPREDSHNPELAEDVAPLPMPPIEAQVFDFTTGGRMSPAPSGEHESAPAVGTYEEMPRLDQIFPPVARLHAVARVRTAPVRGFSSRY